jgi:hypothetical protein
MQREGHLEGSEKGQDGIIIRWYNKMAKDANLLKMLIFHCHLEQMTITYFMIE